MRLIQWLKCLLGKHGPWVVPPTSSYNPKTGVYTGTICGTPRKECVHCGKVKEVG